MNSFFDISDIQPIEIPFEYNGVKYLLKEANGAAAKRFKNERTNRLKYGPNGKLESLKDIADLAPMLVTLCVTTEKGAAIPQTVIEQWPDKLVQRLFLKAKEISGFDEITVNPATILESLLSEKDAPFDQEKVKEWILTLDPTKYRDLQSKIKETSTKEE
jgi:hypothetical protein